MTMLSSLSRQRKEFVLRLQELQYAVINDLQVVDHEPLFATCTKIARRIAMGSKNRQAKSYPEDFKIKQELLDFFAILDQLEDGFIPKITAIKGLPRQVVFQEKLELA